MTALSSFSDLTLLAGQLEGHMAYEKYHHNNSQRFTISNCCDGTLQKPEYDCTVSHQAIKCEMWWQRVYGIKTTEDFMTSTTAGVNKHCTEWHNDHQ